MSYDWTKHTTKRYDESAAGRGGGQRTGVYVSTRAPKALRFDPAFYLRWAFDNVINSLSLLNDPDAKLLVESLLWDMVDIDKEMPFLTIYDRRQLQSMARSGSDAAALREGR